MESISSKKELIEKLTELNDEASLTEVKKAVADFYIATGTSPEKKIWHSSIGRAVFIVSLLLAILSICLIIYFKCNKPLVLTIYAGWTLGPPAWFLYEYVWIFPEHLKFDSDQFADLKYVHEIAGKIWAGLVVVMTVTLLVYGGISLKGG